MGDAAGAADQSEVLVVGAGPTGLTLALELAAWGVAVRVIDAAPDAVHESRALAVQARTLEVLARHGVAERLVSAGDPAGTVVVHAAGRSTAVALADPGVRETAYPFLLFVSQAVTERVLLERLARYGVPVERGRRLVALDQDGDGVVCAVTGADGRTAAARARYVVGCDGAHSAVRKGAGIGFGGRALAQSLVLADLHADGLQPGRVHAYLARDGIQLFFPLGTPAPWRTIVLRAPEAGPGSTIRSVQDLTSGYTHGQVRVRDPVWLTDFAVHGRCADRFRSARVLLAGDAAHIHSPAGAQGMNTGIQDAVNLGWKLALVCRGVAGPALLDTYDAERRPVARAVLRTTTLAFRATTSRHPLVAALRPRVAAVALPLAASAPALRRAVFRRVAELTVRYRHGPLARGRTGPPRAGPRAGDRFPDGPVTVDRRPSTLHARLQATAFSLVLCGPPAAWDLGEVRRLRQRWPWVHVAHLTAHGAAGPQGVGTEGVGTGGVRPGAGEAGEGEAWVTGGPVLRGLGVRGGRTAAYLVRPDGYVAVRAQDRRLRAVHDWLAGLTAAPAGGSEDPRP
jgi:2-polyprenyl-6-methoxyphenol hydroxylase-like FAD-dependent oxidoreductase